MIIIVNTNYVQKVIKHLIRRLNKNKYNNNINKYTCCAKFQLYL